jgi:hypothetical protein
MEPVIKETMWKGKNMGLGASLGRMEARTQGSSTKTISRELESINGLMEGSMMENGRITKWKAMEFLLGLMAENMKVNT